MEEGFYYRTENRKELIPCVVIYAGEVETGARGLAAIDLGERVGLGISYRKFVRRMTSEEVLNLYHSYLDRRSQLAATFSVNRKNQDLEAEFIVHQIEEAIKTLESHSGRFGLNLNVPRPEVSKFRNNPFETLNIG
ncbi:MAG: hypothetical protein AABX11_05400 [Nanoarchaeota archaeon]